MKCGTSKPAFPLRRGLCMWSRRAVSLVFRYARAAGPLPLVATFAAWLVVAPLAFGAGPGSEDAADPHRWLERFASAWDADGWTGDLFGKKDFIRPLTDTAWQVRMRALQALVAGGERSVEPLLNVLRSGEPHERILAAQALGYLASHVPAAPLLEAARNDRDPAVRLYAADALGMRGDATLRPQLQSLLEEERVGDVRKHIEYAIARGERGVDPKTVDQLLAWDPATIATAEVGRAAPDFTLDSLNGPPVSLSQFRDKRAVVLVFIYGDT